MNYKEWSEQKKEKVKFGARCFVIGAGIGFACGMKYYSKNVIRMFKF